MTTTKQALASIQKAARKARRDPQEFPAAASVGDGVRQGDIYIKLIDSIPTGFYQVPAKLATVRLIPGTSRGARHRLDSLEGVKVFTLKDTGERDEEASLIGPVLRLSCKRSVVHGDDAVGTGGDHGTIVLPPGLYQIGYQKTVDGLNKIRRIQD